MLLVNMEGVKVITADGQVNNVPVPMLCISVTTVRLLHDMPPPSPSSLLPSPLPPSFLQNLIMAHALKRILFCTADTKKYLFAMVARNPQTGADGVYCHVFLLPSKEKVGMLTHSLSVPRTQVMLYTIMCSLLVSTKSA